MAKIWGLPAGGELRAKAAHERACGLAKAGIAVAVGYTAVASRMPPPVGWPLTSLALTTFWVVAAFYLGTLGALAEVRIVRKRERERRRAMGSPDRDRDGFMGDVDLVAILLAAVLPFVIIMAYSDTIHQ